MAEKMVRPLRRWGVDIQRGRSSGDNPPGLHRHEQGDGGGQRKEEVSAGSPAAALAEAPPAKAGAVIAPFGKEDTATELQRHAARTQDTLVDAVENAEVAEIKRSVFRALTRLRAAEIKEFDTIARLETQFLS